MNQDQEAWYGTKHAETGKPQSPLPPAFLNRLVEQINPHTRPQSQNQTLSKAQIMCGRWLTLRRVRVGLSLQQLASMVQVPAESLQLLETGSADDTMISSEVSQNLVMKLAPNREDQHLAAEVVALALGKPDALSVEIIGQVLDDLRAADGEQERKKVLVAAVKTRPDPVPARVRGIRDYVRILTDEPAMFDALRVLGQGVNHAAGIMSAIQHLPDRSKDPQTKHVTYFADLLNRMITEGLLVKAEQKVAGAYGRKVQHYQISSEGRHALQIAQWEISIKAEQQAMAAQRAKASPEGNSAPSDQGFATDPLLGT